MHSDHQSYFKFTGPARIEKAVNSLVGLVEGIAVDAAINDRELGFLKSWLDEQESVKNNHPFNELVPVIVHAIADGVLTEDEKLDILWLGRQLCQKNYFDAATLDMQRLHGVLGGISSDGIISEAELRGLSNWLDQNNQLKTLWPYDEVCSLVASVLADGKIDENEHRMLMNFFSGFVSVLDDKTIVKPLVSEDEELVGLCALCPEISFGESVFCFTGASSKYTRDRFSSLVGGLGGLVVNSVSKKVNYLVIGGEGNPCWAYACYGRKVEKAVQLRMEGIPIVIVHENDFHDSVSDLI